MTAYLCLAGNCADTNSCVILLAYDLFYGN